MKVLMLSQGSKIEDQPSYDAAFRRVVVDGRPLEFRNIPYFGFAKEHGAKALWAKVLEENRKFEPDVVFFQFYQLISFWGDEEGADPTRCIEDLRKAPNHPLIIGSQGDPFQPDWFRPWVRIPSKAMMAVVRNADAYFTTSMGRLAEYFVQHGGKNIVFLPHAYANENFECSLDDVSDVELTATMVCSIGISRVRPFGSLYQVSKRWGDATALWKRYGKKFAVYGRGWKLHPAYQGVLEFKDQVSAFKKSLCGVDAFAPVNEVYYASDRPFFILGSGAMLVQRCTPRFEKILTEGCHAEYASSSMEIVKCCDRILSLDATQLTARRKKNIEFVKARHRVIHRVDTIMSVIEALRAHRAGEMSLEESLEHLRLWHFLPDVNLVEERKYGISNWVG